MKSVEYLMFYLVDWIHGLRRQCIVGSALKWDVREASL